MSNASIKQEDFIKKATAAGFEIIEPDPAGKTLLIDMDGGLDDFGKRIRLLNDIDLVECAKVKPSKTPGHYHAIVTMKSHVNFMERQMYELMLGSDPCRAIHNLRHHLQGSPHPELLSTVKGDWKQWNILTGGSGSADNYNS